MNVNAPTAFRLVAALTLCVSALNAGEPPNVVVFLADDMGIGDTSAYRDWTGNAPSEQLATPSLDRLARRGVRFTDAHSPSGRCSPSRYALLTGRYCWRTRLKHWVLYGVHCPPLIERQRVTLPEFLQKAGYRTGMLGKWHLGLTYRNAQGESATGWNDADLTRPLADSPIDHGFDTFFGVSRSHGTSGPDGQQRNGPDQRIGPGWISGRDVIGATGKTKKLDGSYVLHEMGEVLDRKAMELLAWGAKRPAPFFLYFASPSNHGPYTPSKQIAGIPVVAASRYVDGKPTESKRLDFIYQNDVHVGRLLDFLARTPDPRREGKPLIDNTVLIFTSDNGSENRAKRFTGPLRSNKGSVYEGGHRVPFIVSWPAGGIGDGRDDTPGKTSDRLIASNDIYATVAEILGRPLPPTSGAECGAEDSFSRLAAMRGEDCPPRPPIYPNDHKEASKKKSDKRAWIAVRSNAAPIPGQWKLFLDERFAWKGEPRPMELYDLAVDQQESRNLVADPKYTRVVEFLTRQAKSAAGDQGRTRKPE